MVSGGVFRFSDILKLKMQNAGFEKGCLVDTSILFAVSYPNDLYNTAASELFDFLSDLEIPAFTNVNIRAEFLNNQFQVMVPEGLSDFYTTHGTKVAEAVFKKLQSNFTTVSERRKSGKSYKFSTSKMNDWKYLLRENSKSDGDAWFEFCSSYISHRIEKVWEDTCEEIGINFLSLRGSDSKDWMTGPLEWKDVSSLVGNYGIGSFDAMITNLFLNSHFPLLVTADKEIARVIENLKPAGKFVVIPEKLDITI